MRDDLTYRQQRNLNLISEALLTGRTELAEQALEESAMLNEQFGFGGRRGPKLVIDTPMGPATIDPLDVPDSMKDTDAADPVDEPKKKDRGGVLGDIARTPRRVVTKIIRGIDEIFGDNLSNEKERKTATAILIAALLKQLEVDVPTVPSVDPKPKEDNGDNPV